MTGEQQPDARDETAHSPLSDLKEMIHALHGHRVALVHSDLPDDVRSAVEANGERLALLRILRLIDHYEDHGGFPDAYDDGVASYQDLSKATLGVISEAQADADDATDPRPDTTFH